MAGTNGLNPAHPTLVDLFESIDRPTSDAGGALALSARTIEGSRTLRVAKDSQRAPAVLIATSGAGSARPQLKLRHLSVLFDTPCQIETHNGDLEEGRFTVIRCLDGTPEMNRYFLVVAVAALQAHGDDLSPSAINEVVDHLTELFRLMAERPSTSIRGLWAELLVIAKSQEPEKLVAAWHAANEDLHDFNDGETRLEVKASARSRVHRFSADQLAAVDTPLYIVSLIAEQAPAGVGIDSLRDEICEGVGWKAELVQKLDRVIAGALGDRITSAGDTLFDETRAVESMRFYEGGSIPRLEPPFPEGVSKVEFDVVLSNVDSLNWDQTSAVISLLASASPRT